MRSCDEILELISAALDGALTGEEQTELEEHLADCPACSALFAELSGLHTAAGQLGEVPAPAGFAHRVMEAVAADPAQERPGHVTPFPRGKRARAVWKRWAAAAAAVAVVILGATTLNGRIGVESKNNNTATAIPETATDENAAAQYAADSSADYTMEKSFLYTDEAGGDGEDADLGSAPAPENVDKASVVEPQMSEACSVMADDGVPFSAVSCGLLTLTGRPLPEGLDDYEYTEEEDGSRTYQVPADYFFSCLTQLEEQNAANFTYDGSGDETAQYGLIIVENP